MVTFSPYVPEVPTMRHWDMIQYGDYEYIQAPLREIYRLFIEFHIELFRELKVCSETNSPQVQDFLLISGTGEKSESLPKNPAIRALLRRTDSQVAAAENEYLAAEDRATEPNSYKGLHAHLEPLKAQLETIEQGKYEVIGDSNHPLGVGHLVECTRFWNAQQKGYVFENAYVPMSESLPKSPRPSSRTRWISSRSSSMNML